MCLYTNLTEPRDTKGDRVVWKVLFENDAGFVYTPVILERIRKIHLSRENPLIGLGKPELEYGNGTLRVGGGFIHAYTEKPSKDLMRVWNECARSINVRKRIGHAHAICVMCVIPEGTRYYEDGKGRIAAREMRIVPEHPESREEKRRKLFQKIFDM